VTTRQRKTKQGDAVIAALGHLTGFRSAQDVYAILRQQGDSVGLSTVYRHLQALATDGSVDVIVTPEGESNYRLCSDSRQGHHHHLVCRRCGHTEEVEGQAVERWTESVAHKHGFSAVSHTIEIFGLCQDCSAADSITKRTR
jgi:Fur family ferric uptake transcriptional regulator